STIVPTRMSTARKSSIVIVLPLSCDTAAPPRRTSGSALLPAFAGGLGAPRRANDGAGKPRKGGCETDRHCRTPHPGFRPSQRPVESRHGAGKARIVVIKPDAECRTVDQRRALGTNQPADAIGRNIGGGQHPVVR